MNTCKVAGCGKRTRYKELCQMHYQRMKRHGALTNPFRGVGYAGIHNYLVTTQGKASTLACVGCDGAARDWSYNGDCTDELVSQERFSIGLLYCLHPEHYAPRCKRCHVTHDEIAPPAANRPGIDNPNARLTDDDVRAIRAEYATGARQKDLAVRYQTPQANISKIVRRDSWKHL